MSETQNQSDPLIGRVVDRRFRVVRALGRGGMGAVYLARQSPLDRAVALKVLTSVSDPERIQEFQSRFFLEAATSARLKHQNTITVFDYGSDVVEGQQVFYIAMELVEGITLSRAIKKLGPMSPKRTMNILLQVAHSLHEAHQKGIVHRDLKPGNVMLIDQPNNRADERDFVKVLDFGLAKTFEGVAEASLTKAGTFLGSPRYVSPEQIEGRPVDPRADIYSFGCVAYRMLCQIVPFDGETAVEIMMKHLEDAVPPLPVDIETALPEGLADLVFDCLEKEASSRPADMGEVIVRLQQIRATHDPHLIALDDDAEITDRDHHALIAPVADASEAPGEGFFAASPRSPFESTPSLVNDGFRTQAKSISESDLSYASLEHERPELVDVEFSRRQKRHRSRAIVTSVLFVCFVALVVFGAATGSFTRFFSLFDASSSQPQTTEEIILQLRSSPSGADVFETGKMQRLGTTPFGLTWSLSDEPNTRQFRFTKAKHHDVILDVTAPISDEPSMTILREVTLPPR